PDAVLHRNTPWSRTPAISQVPAGCRPMPIDVEAGAIPPASEHWAAITDAIEVPSREGSPHGRPPAPRGRRVGHANAHRLDAEGLGEAPVGLEGIAVLHVTGGVMSAGQQQGVAIMGAGVPVVLQEAERDLLVVGVVAFLHRRQ